jgi:hypothetical protein
MLYSLRQLIASSHAIAIGLMVAAIMIVDTVSYHNYAIAVKALVSIYTKLKIALMLKWTMDVSHDKYPGLFLT